MLKAIQYLVLLLGREEKGASLSLWLEDRLKGKKGGFHLKGYAHHSTKICTDCNGFASLAEHCWTNDTHTANPSCAGRPFGPSCGVLYTGLGGGGRGRVFSTSTSFVRNKIVEAKLTEREETTL